MNGIFRVLIIQKKKKLYQKDCALYKTSKEGSYIREPPKFSRGNTNNFNKD